MAFKTTAVAVAVACAVLAGCKSAPPAPPPLNDGELALPADYKSWPKFLSEIQRPDAKQVREIYMNPTATKGTADKGFPNGSVFVMENYVAKETNGVLDKGADGKLVKGNMAAIFVMGKNPGWAAKAPESLKNGTWIYSAYTPAGAKGPQDLNTCRACHLPLGQAKDFVHRYDEYFSTKKSSLSVESLKLAHSGLSADELATVRALSR